MKTKEDIALYWMKQNSMTLQQRFWEAMEEYRLQSHPSPMSAEQVELLEASKIALHTLDCIEFTRDQGTASKRLETAISKIATTPSVKADGWVSVEERLPEKGERVIVCTDNWVVACCYINIHGEWKMAYDSSLFHGKITHYQPLPAPPNVNNKN
jgi:hypothetical protein